MIRPICACLCGFLLGLNVSATTTRGAEKLPAFPGAEGFGAYTPGGRGGKVLFVTNLDDYHPQKDKPIAGSLRAACCAAGPRTVIFGVSGTIPLKAPLKITEPYLTLAGQTAPGDGICVKNHETHIHAHDVIVRYMRFRVGDEIGRIYREAGKGFSPDGLGISEGGCNVIIDHCSASWAIDEVLSVSGAGITNVTVQWCFITESLNRSFHEKGPHGYGSLLRTNGNVSFHHNLYAHHSSRSPRPGTYGEGSILLDFRNNVIYDSQGYSSKDPVRMNYVGNYIKRPRGRAFKVGGDTTHLFVDGNVLEGSGTLIDQAQPSNLAATAFEVVSVATDSAPRAYERVLASAGATLPKRDAVDQRVVKQVSEGSGKLIDSQQEVGGWPELRAEAPPQDSDRDGMPDAWEIKRGLNPNDPRDANGDLNHDGYTNLEKYLNGINATNKPAVESR